jgi:hypothetical protein
LSHANDTLRASRRRWIDAIDRILPHEQHGDWNTPDEAAEAIGRVVVRAEQAEAERDAAIARAEKAEAELARRTVERDRARKLIVSADRAGYENWEDAYHALTSGYDAALADEPEEP